MYTLHNTPSAQVDAQDGKLTLQDDDDDDAGINVSSIYNYIFPANCYLPIDITIKIKPLKARNSILCVCKT